MERHQYGHRSGVFVQYLPLVKHSALIGRFAAEKKVTPAQVALA